MPGMTPISLLRRCCSYHGDMQYIEYSNSKHANYSMLDMTGQVDHTENTPWSCNDETSHHVS